MLDGEVPPPVSQAVQSGVYEGIVLKPMKSSDNPVSALHSFNPLPTNDAYMRHELHNPLRIYMGGLILGVNTLYRLLCFFKLFPMVGKG